MYVLTRAQIFFDPVVGILRKAEQYPIYICCDRKSMALAWIIPDLKCVLHQNCPVVVSLLQSRRNQTSCRPGNRLYNDCGALRTIVPRRGQRNGVSQLARHASAGHQDHERDQLGYRATRRAKLEADCASRFERGPGNGARERTEKTIIVHG